MALAAQVFVEVDSLLPAQGLRLVGLCLGLEVLGLARIPGFDLSDRSMEMELVLAGAGRSLLRDWLTIKGEGDCNHEAL